MTLYPGMDGRPAAASRLVRIATDTFGFGLPAKDVVLGPSARLFHAARAMQVAVGREGAMVPVADFVDGINIVEITPATPVEVFHLAFAEHDRIDLGGMSIESYHPGPALRFSLRGEILALFLSLFPHLASIEDFGLAAFPRLSLGDLEMIGAA